MTDREEIAVSYLDHIRIAVEAGDKGAPFRDFFDNWHAFWCKSDNHRTRNLRVRWFNNPCALKRLEMLKSLDFRSTGASDVMKSATTDPSGYRQRRLTQDTATRLVVDHAVPIGVLVEMLFDRRSVNTIELSRKGIEAHLTERYRLGLLTFRENAQLRDAGLGSCMPADWDGIDPFARYRSIGIVGT